MRFTFILLAVAALALFAFLVFENFWAEEERPRIDPEASLPPRTLIVHHGEDRGLELLLRPFYLEPSRDAFNDRVLAEKLGTRGEYRFAMLWILNLGTEPRALPEGIVAGLRRPVDVDWRGHSLVELAARAPSETPRSYLEEMKIWSASDRSFIDPGEFLRVAVALPRQPRQDQIRALEFGEDAIALLPRQALGDDLEAYDLQPKGRFTQLLRPSDQDAKLGNEDTTRTRDGN